MMRTPASQLLQVIQEVCPSRDISFHSTVLQLARKMIEKRIEVLHKATPEEPAPVLVDRLSFAWAALRQADVLIRSPKKSAMPARTDRVFAAALLEPVLGVPLSQEFLQQLLDDLRLGPNAEHLYHYWFFRKATAPTKLPPPFGDAGARKDTEALRTVIWWSLRRRSEQFVQPPTSEPLRIEFEYVVERTLAELPSWCGADIRTSPTLASDVEASLNRWLSYSHIESGATDDSVFEIARAFVRFNGLNTRLVVADRSAPQSAGNEQVDALNAAIREHQATIQQYADENRRLEQRIADLLSKEPTPSSDSPSSLPTPADSPRELREVLKLIDSKYSFDVLNGVQLGQESHLTLRSFVAHIFYSLRKRGFGEYPQTPEFDLTYDASGLYDCDGFEVAPGETARVVLVKKGWALLAKDAIVPIRRAQVRLQR
jgi:hypothetical protein